MPKVMVLKIRSFLFVSWLNSGFLGQSFPGHQKSEEEDDPLWLNSIWVAIAKKNSCIENKFKPKWLKTTCFPHFFKRLFSTCFYCCSNKSHAGLCCSSTEIVEMCPQKNQAWTTKSTRFDIRLGKHHKWDDLFILFLSKSHEEVGRNGMLLVYTKKGHT